MIDSNGLASVATDDASRSVNTRCSPWFFALLLEFMRHNDAIGQFLSVLTNDRNVGLLNRITVEQACAPQIVLRQKDEHMSPQFVTIGVDDPENFLWVILELRLIAITILDAYDVLCRHGCLCFDVNFRLTAISFANINGTRSLRRILHDDLDVFFDHFILGPGQG
jgi:hypothetical protein